MPVIWIVAMLLAAAFIAYATRLLGSRTVQTALGEDTEAGVPAQIGPDQTNVSPPESYVVHHEGKEAALTVANTALRERTRHLTPDAPGDAGVRAAVPGRAVVREKNWGHGRATDESADGPADQTPRGASGLR